MRTLSILTSLAVLALPGRARAVLNFQGDMSCQSQVNAILDDAMTTDECYHDTTMKDTIAFARNTAHIITIQCAFWPDGDRGRAADANGNVCARTTQCGIDASNGTGTDAVVHWNPDATDYNVVAGYREIPCANSACGFFACNDCPMDAAAALIHELVHATNAAKGKFIWVANNTTGTPQNGDDLSTLLVENIYRRAKNLCQRQRFGCSPMPASISPVCCDGNQCSGQCCGGTVCSDPNSDTQNCGACGNACGQGQACCGGSCAQSQGACPCGCAAGTTCCGGQCVSLTDDHNCAACGNDCPSHNVGSLSYHCCNRNGAFACYETTQSNFDCGGCGNVCGGSQQCCSSSCRDLSSDPHHCGSCTTDCTVNGQSCGSGACH